MNLNLLRAQYGRMNGSALCFLLSWVMNSKMIEYQLIEK